MAARSFTLDKRRQGNITVERTIVDDVGEQIQVILHNTAVVVKMPDGRVMLNSGGWSTLTTKTAINQALRLLGRAERVVMKSGHWFLVQRDGKKEIRADFFDGMCLR
jgi:hypothetical protein